MHVGSDTAKKFHHIVDAKVAAVGNIVNLVLVEREFANTVDGIIGVVGFCLVLSTVDGTTQNKTTTLDATEVASLHCVDITAFVDNRFLGLPIATLILGKTIIFFAQDDIALRITTFLVVFLTCVFGYIKRLLTFCQLIIIVCICVLLQIVKVCTVIGNVQLAITINKGKVAITIKTTYTIVTNSDKVSTKGIDYRSRSIAINRIGKCHYLVGTCRNVTTGKDSIVNGDTYLVYFLPYILVCVITRQLVKSLGFDV